MSDPGPAGVGATGRPHAVVVARTDPRVRRTAEGFEQAIVELASERPVSQISVAELSERAGVTRATFYNHYTSPLEVLFQVLLADLEPVHLLEDVRRAEGGHSGAEMLRLSIVEVADHIDRFKALYEHSLSDPADGAVYEALVRHFRGYAIDFMARCSHPDLPRTNHAVIAQFVANGFAGAIKAWLSDATVTKSDLVDACAACAPVWWSETAAPPIP